jgi:hypothetical protein
MVCFFKAQSALSEGKMSNTARFAMTLVALLLLGSGVHVAKANAIAPNAIDTSDGSTISSPITFENFIAAAMAVPGYTSVQFTFTIKDPCNNNNGCSGTTDAAEVYYGPLVANKTSATATPNIVIPFATLCMFSVTIGTNFNPTQTVSCPLSTSEADPTNSNGSFVYDLKNGGLSIVAACVEHNVTSYQSGVCTTPSANLNDAFFFSGAAGDTTNASMTLLPQAAVSAPEPATGTFLLSVIGSLGVLRIIAKARSAR